MPNRYAGTCYRCGEEVPPGAGVFEKTSRSQARKWPGKIIPKWLTQHHHCAAEFKGTARHYQYAPDIQPLPEANP